LKSSRTGKITEQAFSILTILNKDIFKGSLAKKEHLLSFVSLTVYSVNLFFIEIYLFTL